jgi:hypothetical protein
MSKSEGPYAERPVTFDKCFYCKTGSIIRLGDTMQGKCDSCGMDGYELTFTKGYDPANLKKGYKHDDGKLDWSLLPWSPIIALVKLFMVGAKKYDRDNWKKGMDYSRCYNALLRHLTVWWNGERIDPETKCHHLTSVMWCALVLLYYEMAGKAYEHFDDRPIDGPANNLAVDELMEQIRWGVEVEPSLDPDLSERVNEVTAAAYERDLSAREKQIEDKLVNAVIKRLLDTAGSGRLVFTKQELMEALDDKKVDE